MNIGNESEFVEFKKSSSELKEAIVSIASILNKHHKGTLYFGVKNNGEVVGQQIGEDTINQISRGISINIKPSFVYTIEQKQTAEGNTFIEITFHGERTPYSAFNRYYLRFHDEDRVMDNELLREYYRQSSNDYSYWEKAKSNCTIDDIDNSLINEYYQKSLKTKRINYKFDDTKKFLSKMGFMYDENYLNNAGEVLFSKNNPVRIKLATFASETRLTILNMEVYEGNVFGCIDKAMDYLYKNLMWKIEINGSIERKEIPEIPIEALREIVVNAFSHGQYDSNTDFEIDVYKNRISIYSPGHFPKPYSPIDFASGYIEPIPMNDSITQALYKCGIIEQMSTGFERTFDLCEKSNVNYDYQETAYGFRFQFYRTNYDTSLNGNEKKILKAIQEDNNITISEISIKTELSIRTVARYISSLKSKGLIKRIGSDKNGHWHII